MTIAIASVVNQEFIVALSDSMISLEYVSLDKGATKIKPLPGNSWFAMYAAKDISPVTPILMRVNAQLNKNEEFSLDHIANVFCNSYGIELSLHRERSVLTCYGLRIKQFYANSRKYSERLVEETKHQIDFAHYNFCRVHQTLRCTPAMEGGITNHVWGLDELLTSAI